MDEDGYSTRGAVEMYAPVKPGAVAPEQAVADLGQEEEITILDQEDVDGFDEEQKAKKDLDGKIGNIFDRLKSRLKKINYSNKTKEWVRRIYRLLLIFVILGGLVAAMWYYVGESSVRKTTTFDGSSFTLEVSGCKVWLYNGSGTKVEAYVNSRIKELKPEPFWNTTDSTDYYDTSDTKLKMLNPNDDEEACDVELEIGNIGSFSIQCKDNDCPIFQEDDKIEVGSFSISRGDHDGDSTVYLKELVATDVFLNVTGSVSIQKLTSPGTGQILADTGDIYIASTTNAELIWNTTFSGAYAFQSRGEHVTEPTCIDQTIQLENSTLDVSSCNGRYDLCYSSGCNPSQRLYLTSIDGGIYVNSIDSEGNLPANHKVASYRDNPDILIHKVDIKSKIEIKRIVDQLTGDVQVDQFTMITMPGLNQDEGMWLFVTAEAYTQYKPWWMSLFSFGLLLPEPQHIDVRFVPWPFFQTEPIDEEDLDQLGVQWLTLKKEFGDDKDHFVMWMSNDDDDRDDWYNISNDQTGLFSKELKNLEQNLPLLLALVFSFVLAAIGGVGGAIGTFWALKKYSLTFWKELEHQRRYKMVKLTLGKRNNADEIENQIGEISDDAVPGKGRIPPPFSLPDLAVVKYRKEKTDSLKFFLKKIIHPTGDADSAAQSTRMLDLKEKYEAFCFVNGYAEKIIRENKQLLYAYGFQLSTLSDSTTEVFKHIRFTTQRELEDLPEPRQIPQEDSLSFFVRSMCKVTAFDNDSIFLKDFIVEYEKFNRMYRSSNPVPITKRAMAALGVQFERLTLNIIKSDGTNRLKLDKIDDIIFKPNNDPWVPKWFLYDAVSVILHIILIFVLLAPICVWTIYGEALHYELSTRPSEQFITMADVKFRWWMIPDKMLDFPFYTWIAIGFNCLIGIFSIFEATSYYMTQTFPWKTESLMKDSFLIRKISQKIFIGQLMLLGAFVGGYVILCLCWCILGAVLNPEVFLPYAAASATFIVFVLGKLKSSVTLWREVLDEIVTFLTERLKGMLSGMLDKVIGNIKNNSIGNIGQALASGRYMDAINKTPLGAVMSDLGIDPQLIAAIANGDPIAITMLADKFGIDPIIVEALMAALNKDIEALSMVIPKLATIPGIDLNPELAKAFIMLAWKQNDERLRTAVKMTVVHFVRIMAAKYGLPAPNAPPPPGQIAQPGMPQMPPKPAFEIDPRVIEALVGMARGDVTHIIDVIKQGEKMGLIPEKVGVLIDFLNGLINPQVSFIDSFIDLIITLLGVPEDIAQGIGSMCDENYHSRLVRRMHKMGDPKYPSSIMSFDKGIDALVKRFGIEESLIIQMLIVLARRAPGTFQRILPLIVEFLNQKLNWSIDPETFSCLFTMINGAKISINKLSERFGIDAKLVKCFAAFVMAPITTDALPPGTAGRKRRGTVFQSSKDEPIFPMKDPNPTDELERSRAEDARESIEEIKLDDAAKGGAIPTRVTVGKEMLMGLADTTTTTQGIALDTEESQGESPAVRIVRDYLRPSGETMEWIGKKFKLSGDIVYGLYAMLITPRARHNRAIKEITREVLRRCRIDESHLKFCTRLVQLITSRDPKTIKKAQAFLNIKFPQLTMVAKKFISPSDLPAGYMVKHCGFPGDHPLVKRRQVLNWARNPKQCKEWCHAVGTQIMQLEGIPHLDRLMVRGQLMIAVQCPALFLKKMLETNCDADEEQLKKFKAFITSSFIKGMTANKRRDAVNSLSRLFEVPVKLMSNFVDISLANSQRHRNEAITAFMVSLEMPQELIDTIDSAIEDFKDQFDLLKKNIGSFKKLAGLLGVPDVLIEALSPGMIKRLETRPAILVSFIKKFCNELGLRNPIIQDSLGAFLLGDTEGLENLSKALGLKPDALPNAIRLFGDIDSSLMIELVGQVLDILGCDAKIKNIAKALAAIISNHKGTFSISPETKFDVRTMAKASTILGQQTGIPSIIFEGITAALTADMEGVKTVLTQLCSLTLGQFTMDEGICRGFISMALGDVSGIEDIASAIGFDADVAEILAVLSGKMNLSHAFLKASGAFNKVCVKLGLESGTLAAVIALAKRDIENAREIIEDLDDNGSLSPAILKALMAVFYWYNPDKTMPKEYRPEVKNAMVKKYIRPLASLFEVPDKNVATFIIRLTQGDASILGEMYEKFGWSGMERAMYAALVCLIDQSPFCVKAPVKGAFSWMAYKEIDPVCAQLSQIFQHSANGIEKLFRASRDDETALNWIVTKLGLKGIRDAKRFIKMIVYDGDVDSDDEDQEDNILELDTEALKVDDNDVGIVRQDSFTSVEGIEASFGSMDEMEEMGEQNEQYEFYEKKFMDMVGMLNQDFDDGDKPFTEDSVKLILSLACGYLGHVDIMDNIMADLYGHQPPISMRTVKELFVIVSGDIESLEYIAEMDLDAVEQKGGTEDIEEESILKMCQLDPEGFQLKFLMQLAMGDIEWIDICKPDSEFPIASSLFPDLKVFKGIFAILSLDPLGLAEFIEPMCQFFEFDVDVAQIIIYLAIGSLHSAPNGIIPLAERLQVEPAIVNAFVAISNGNAETRLNAVTPLAEKIGINPDVIDAIFTVMKGDIMNGWVKVLKLVLDSKVVDVDDSKVVLLKGVIDIIIGNWEVKVPIEAFEKGVGKVHNKMDSLMTPAEQLVREKLAEMLQFNEIIKHGGAFLQQIPENMRNKIPLMIVDIIAGIATNDADVIAPVMMLFGVPKDQHKLIAALINLYNGNSSMIYPATEDIEEYIEEHASSLKIIPPGLIQAIFGALRKFPNIMAKGIGRAVVHLSQQWGADVIDPSIPQFIVSIVQKQAIQDFQQFKSGALFIIKKLTGVEVDPRLLRMFLALISTDALTFIKSASSLVGIPQEAMNNMYQVALTGNVNNIKNLNWLTGKLAQVFNMPADVVDAMLLLISGKVDDLDAGRKGMGSTLHTLVKFMVDKLPLPEQFKRPITDEEGQSDYAIIKVLDAFFLASTDPFKYKDSVLAAIPVLGGALLGDAVPDQAIKLLTGIVILFQSEGNPEMRDRGVAKLAEAFDIDGRIVRGLIALAKGDWKAMEDMVARVCEFDPKMIQNLVQLMKRLKMVKEADSIDGQSPSENADLFEQLKEKIDQGADQEQIFNMLDVDGSGELDFEEFSEVLKYYDMQMSDERQLQIFSRFDVDGSAKLDMQEFDAAMQYIKKTISKGAMDQLGLSKANLIKIFLALVFVLLLLFVFIFLGIMGFTTGSTLGSVVNSIMPISAGGVLGGGTQTKIQDKIKRIKPSIQRIIQVFTLSDI